MALVLPYEATYVRYARSLWKYLGKHFGSVRVVRTHERLFPEIYQEVILLFADNYGTQTDHVVFEAYCKVSDLEIGKKRVEAKLSMAQLAEGKRLFVEALLPQNLRELLSKLSSKLMPASDVVRFHIGYVSGDKEFFHPSCEKILSFDLPAYHLHNTVSSARSFKNGGLHTSGLKETALLYSPLSARISESEALYIAEGEAAGVSARYKCRVRKPWYIVPGLQRPDLLISVFTERPTLMINDAGLLASNSILCGFCKTGTDAGQMAVLWYTSLTMLQCELEVHALGGGVLVMVPKEAGNILLPKIDNIPLATNPDLIERLLEGDVEAAYQAGDAIVLEKGLGLTLEEIGLIREGAQELAYWRTAYRSHR